MPADVAFRLLFLSVLAYAGLAMLSQPATGIRKVGEFMQRLQEFEAVLTQEPLGEPIEIDATHRAQFFVRLFGVAFVSSALVGAAIQLGQI